ncbi:MAG: SDR family NAD(P)-dependent oxidoreductase, partial [Chloroflexota bacterium]
FERQRHWIEPGKPLAADAAPADPLAKIDNLDEWFYRPTWKPARRAPAMGAEQPLRWLVFRDRYGLGDEIVRQLSRDGHEAISVSAGETFARLGDSSYVLNPDNRADYDALITDLAGRLAIPDRIVHLWSIAGGGAMQDGSGPRRGLDGYETSQALGFYSLLFLAQAIGGEGLEDAIHIGVVSNQIKSVDGEPVLRPERATLLGPCTVIPREFPGLTCQSIDVILSEDMLSNPGPDGERIAGQIVAELIGGTGERVVALRGDDRWVEAIEAATVSVPRDGERHLRDKGVYLITGGLGGIGLVQAEYLARTAHARLVLVGRTGLPERETWERWLGTHSPHDQTSQRIRKVLELEALGAEVMVASADVADVEQMRAVVSTVHEQFGPVHGVIHAAGILNDGVIQFKTRGAAESVLAPKVRGALVLDAVLDGEPLDFFIVFSSTSSILGPAGQVDYAGANAFLNAFAQSRAGQGATKTVALNWGVWQEVGMTARAVSADAADGSAAFQGEAAGHPLLGVRTTDAPDKTVYQAQYATSDQWALDQHRLRDGLALIPGTGYLEIARAAMNRGTGNAPVTLTDVAFLSPLSVLDDESKDVRITVEQDGAASTFTIESSAASRDRGTGQPDWEEHARATVAFEDSQAPALRCLDEIRARCQSRTVVFERGQRTKQEEYVTFGPRWQVLRRTDFGTDEALASLSLPAQFSADLDVYRLHPALLDIAAHIGLPLIAGYEQADEFYVPFACKQVRIWRELPASIYSHVRYRPESARNGLAVFDVCIMDSRGAVLAEINEFMLKRIDATALAAVRQDNRRTRAVGAAAHLPASQASRSDLPDLVRIGMTEGILPAEGAQILSRIIAGEVGPRIVASSLDLHALIEQLEATSRAVRAGSAGTSKQTRADTGGTYVAPRNDIERQLAGFWQELMGLERAGIHDDFFDVGGYSLIAVRLFA